MGDFDHWYGVGRAPRFSREVAHASVAVQKAEKALFEALQRSYPLGSDVYVIHGRGCFVGTVAGWDHWGSRVSVKNARTMKTAKWWAAHVQLVNATTGVDVDRRLLHANTSK